MSQWYAKDGRFAFPARGSQLVSALSRYCPGNFNGSPAQCLSRHGYTQWSSYQPGSRFWPFQWIEGGWLLALSVLLIAASVWLVRRRAATDRWPRSTWPERITSDYTLMPVSTASPQFCRPSIAGR